MSNIKKNHDNIFDELKNRGLIAQCTDEKELYEHLKKPISLYIGTDITAPSLHLGHLLWLRTLQRFIAYGHNVIVLFGGITSLIGDPTGKKKERILMDAQTVEENEKHISEQVNNILGTSVSYVNNKNWFGHMKYFEVLRDYGRHMSLAQMLSMETVKDRLNNQLPISLLEFNYMVFQAVDFLYLYDNNNCILQMGGSDQWGNIVTGTHLIKKVNNKQAYGLTLPLLLNSQGNKMGKTEEGALWLNKNMCSPYDFWQYIRNIHDDDTKKMFLFFSTLSAEEINKLFEKESNINNLKKQIADEIVGWLHGNETLEKVHQEVETKFQNKESLLFSIPEVQNSSLAFNLQYSSLENICIEDLLVMCELLPTKSEAKRKITQGAISINGEQVKEINTKINKSMFPQGVLCIDFGKKNRRYIIIK